MLKCYRFFQYQMVVQRPFTSDTSAATKGCDPRVINSWLFGGVMDHVRTSTVYVVVDLYGNDVLWWILLMLFIILLKIFSFVQDIKQRERICNHPDIQYILLLTFFCCSCIVFKLPMDRCMAQQVSFDGALDWPLCHVVPKH